MIPPCRFWAGVSGGGFVFTLSARIIGLVALVRGLYDVVSVAATFTVEKTRHGMIGSDTAFRYWGPLAGGLLLIVLGGYLLTGAKHMVRLLYTAQESGTQAPEEK